VVKTYPVVLGRFFWHSAASMFLRTTNRRKDGKDHRYFSVVENRRLASGKTAQRTVLYLGEVNDSQQAVWRKTLEVFDEQQQRSRTLSLFPEHREIPADAADSLQVRLSGLELRPRRFGDCWLACEIWGQLGLDQFWQTRLPQGRETVSWEKVLELLVVNHLLEAASEFRVHRQWFLSTAMDELLNVDYAVAEKDRLYRCLDRVLEHKRELFVWLRQKWADLFQADSEVLLYDLTSTYFEGEMEENPKAKRGYSRDGRPDCLQLVVALVVTTGGFPLAYEVMDGNTSDCTTLRGFLERIELFHPPPQRVVHQRRPPAQLVHLPFRIPGVAVRPVRGQVSVGVVAAQRREPVRGSRVRGRERRARVPGHHRPTDVAEVVSAVVERLPPLARAAIHRAQPRQIVVGVRAGLRVVGVERVGDRQLPQRAVGVPGQRAVGRRAVDRGPVLRHAAGVRVVGEAAGVGRAEGASGCQYRRETELKAKTMPEEVSPSATGLAPT
jgi:hypothetical protein